MTAQKHEINAGVTLEKIPLELEHNPQGIHRGSPILLLYLRTYYYSMAPFLRDPLNFYRPLVNVSTYRSDKIDAAIL